MLIPQTLLKCVAFIGCYDKCGLECVLGTGFFVVKPTTESSYCYLLTAAHVIDEIKNGKANKGNVNKARVCVRLNNEIGKAVWLELVLGDWDDLSGSDVAAYPFPLGSVDYDHDPLLYDDLAIPWVGSVDREPTKEPYGPGDEVVLPGMYYRHYGDNRNVPIVRVGNIAALADRGELIETNSGMLYAHIIEARSIGGLSGSPVFAYLRGGGTVSIAHVGDEGLKQREAERTSGLYVFMGMVHGHYDVPHPHGNWDVNEGLAVVVAREDVIELMGKFENKEKAADAEKRKRRLPKSDSVGNAPEMTPQSFDDALRLASRKIIDPSEPESKDSQTSE